MIELIKSCDFNGKKAYSARSLYQFLEVTTDFTSWCKRMFEYGFSDGTDYALIKNGEPETQLFINPNPKHDYVLSLDCAKEISMIQRTDKGKQARQYFIQMEQAALSLTLPDFNDPVKAARAWADAKEQQQIAETKVKELAPKAEVYDQISNCDNLKTVGEVAKLIGSGEHRLFHFMRENGIIMPNTTIPYQKYITAGYFKVKTHPIAGQNRNYTQSFFTSKGELWIADVFKTCHK